MSLYDLLSLLIGMPGATLAITLLLKMHRDRQQK